MDTRVRSAAAGAVREVAALGLMLGVLVLSSCGLVATANSREPLYAGGPTSLKFQRPIEDRVIDLPEDGDMWHFVVVSDTTESSKQMHQELAASPRIAELANQVKLHSYPASHWWVKQYFGGEPLPLILLTDQMGERVYKACGSDMPRSGEELADELESSILAFDCPDCTPGPTRPKSRIPNLRPNSGDGSGPAIDPVAIGLLVITAAAGIAALIAKRNQSSN